MDAALRGERENVYRAVMVDSLTSALLNLDQIRAMTDELLEAHAPLLPAALRPDAAESVA